MVQWPGLLLGYRVNLSHNVIPRGHSTRRCARSASAALACRSALSEPEGRGAAWTDAPKGRGAAWTVPAEGRGSAWTDAPKGRGAAWTDAPEGAALPGLTRRRGA